MIPEEMVKLVKITKDLTATTALILIVVYLIWSNTGDRNQAIYAARASAEEAVKVSRANKDMLEGLSKVISEDSGINRMILIQICINTASGDRQIIAQCANYR